MHSIQTRQLLNPTASVSLLLAVLLSFFTLPAGAAAAADAKVSHSLDGHVVSVGESFGNLYTDINLTGLEVNLGQPFTLTCNSHSVEAVLASDYSDVAKGEWLALEEEDGSLQFAISFGDAGKELGCGVGDAIALKIEAPASFR